MSTRPKRPQSRTRSNAGRGSDRSITHLHVVVDDELHKALEAHARKLEGVPPRARAKAKAKERPNVSAAVRDLLRSGLGLPTVEAA